MEVWRKRLSDEVNGNMSSSHGINMEGVVYRACDEYRLKSIMLAGNSKY